jgi:hypothetical protein
LGCDLRLCHSPMRNVRVIAHRRRGQRHDVRHFWCLRTGVTGVWWFESACTKRRIGCLIGQLDLGPGQGVPVVQALCSQGLTASGGNWGEGTSVVVCQAKVDWRVSLVVFYSLRLHRPTANTRSARKTYTRLASPPPPRLRRVRHSSDIRALFEKFTVL